MDRRVLIVGAGIAGHTLACALARRSIRPDMVEIKPDWEILGAGMYVQNNALRGFDEIGVADAIIAAGWVSPTGVAEIADAQGGILARTVVPPCPGSDFPGYVPIARPRLHDILHAASERAGIEVRMGVSVEHLTQSADAVDVSFTDGRSGRYDLVVGADGINSRIRSWLFPDVKPAYSGFSNWRAILPMPEPRSEILWQMGSERSFGIIPISQSELYVAGVTKEPGNPWFDHGCLHSLMRERFDDFGGPAADMLAMVTRPEQVIYTPIHEVIMPLPWSRGRVVLVGDAAHASTPFWAQGASMAVEDVVLLARLLEQDDRLDEILAEWQRRRHPRCVFVQEGSKGTGVRGHAPGTEAQLRAREHIVAHAQDDVTRRYTTLNEPI